MTLTFNIFPQLIKFNNKFERKKINEHDKIHVTTKHDQP